MVYRKECDSIGELLIPVDAYYGVNAKRASDNFRITHNRLDPLFVKSMLEVKKAAVLANLKLNELPPTIAESILVAINRLLSANQVEAIIVDPIQGGAGTSSNMNINEVIANYAIEGMGGTKGDYSLVSPNDHVNKGQSTNDVFPTAGKITFLKKIADLTKVLTDLADTFLRKLNSFRKSKKWGERN